MAAIHSVTSGRSAAGESGQMFGPCIGRGSSGQVPTEVVALLQVGHTRCQFAAEREPATPRRPAVGQGNPLFLLGVTTEEVDRNAQHRVTQLVADSVVAKREEAELAACPVDLGCRCSRGHVDDRQHALQRRPPPVPESMLVTTAQLIVVGSAVFIAAFMQIVAGFGFALLAMPVMTLAIDPKIAVVVSALTGVFVTSWQAIRSRADADRVLVRRLTTAAYVGMPFGLLVFIEVNDDVLRLLLGSPFCMAVVMLALRINMHHAGPRFDYAAGFVSGVLNTSLSTNGPPLVFALQARQLSAVTFRATITMVFALSNILGPRTVRCLRAGSPATASSPRPSRSRR